MIGEDGIDRYSNGELQTLKRCRRKWWLAYYRRLGFDREPAVGAAPLGTRIHQALAVYYQPEPQNPIEEFERQILLDLEAFPEESVEIEKQGELGRIMLEGYVEWLEETGVDQGLRVIASEKIVEVASGIPGVLFISKQDVQVEREPANVLLFMDHKTVGNLTEPPRMLPLDEQMLHYHFIEHLEFLALKAKALEEGTHPPTERFTEGGLYNMLRKVKRTARATPPFFDRVEVRHNIHELRSYWVRVHAEVQEVIRLRAALDSGVDPKAAAYPSPRSTCTWDCEFFPVCPMFDDGSNAEGMLEQIYITKNPLQRYQDDLVPGTIDD